MESPFVIESKVLLFFNQKGDLMNRSKEIALFAIVTLTVSCSGTNSNSETASITSGGTGGEIIPVTLSPDLAEVKVDILKLDNFIAENCVTNCSPPKTKKLINPNGVDSSKLENMIFGFDETGGYSWNKLKYFGNETSKSFLEDFLRNQILDFNLDKLCALIEVLPIGVDGRFLEGSHLINTADFSIEEKCGVLPSTLNMDGTISVEKVQNGNFERIIKFNGEEIHFGDNPDKFVYGEWSLDKMKRLTVDKDNQTLSLETVLLTPAKDSLIRIYFDEIAGEGSMLVNHTGSESVQFTYSADLGEDLPRYGKLNIRAESLGGVETSSPQAVACIDLSTGLISGFDYDTCPISIGSTINEVNPALFVLYFPAISPLRAELDFVTEQDIFMMDL